MRGGGRQAVAPNIGDERRVRILCGFLFHLEGIFLKVKDVSFDRDDERGVLRSIGEIETASYHTFFPFARNRHSRQSFAARNHRVNKSGVASPASPFIRRAEPQHEKLRLKDGAAYHLPPQVRTESARRRVAGALALRAARADRPEKPYRVKWWPDAAPWLAGARRERPAGAPTRHARRRRASEGHDVDRPRARLLAAPAGVVSGASRARRCARRRRLGFSRSDVFSADSVVAPPRPR